jgi:hypothetical protein
VSRVAIEATSWNSVEQSGDEWLIERFAATKPIATDLRHSALRILCASYVRFELVFDYVMTMLRQRRKYTA